MPSMKSIQIAISLLLLLVASPAHAVPALLPLLPILGVLIVKGALLISSIFFFVLSLVRKHKMLFLAIGIVLLLAFALLMIFVRHG